MSGYFKNDLFKRIREVATKIIDDAVNFVSNGLKHAQEGVQSAIESVKSLDNSIKYHQDQIWCWKKYCSNAKWPSKIWKCASAGLHIAFHGLAIAGIELAKVIAIGVLEVANAILAGLDFAFKVRLIDINCVVHVVQYGINDLVYDKSSHL